MTMDGPTETEVPLEPLADKWKAFGFRVFSCDGHSFPSLAKALDAAFDDSTDQPAVVIAETIKGKGIDFMEGRPEWHYGSIDSEHFTRALASLRNAHEQAKQSVGSAF
jgi:transketolase